MRERWDLYGRAREPTPATPLPSNTVLINQAMADKFWPGQDPIGRRFGQGNDRTKWYEVVGVIGSIRSLGLTRSSPFEFYRPDPSA